MLYVLHFVAVATFAVRFFDSILITDQADFFDSELNEKRDLKSFQIFEFVQISLRENFTQFV